MMHFGADKFLCGMRRCTTMSTPSTTSGVQSRASVKNAFGRVRVFQAWSPTRCAPSAWMQLKGPCHLYPHVKHAAQVEKFDLDGNFADFAALGPLPAHECMRWTPY